MDLLLANGRLVDGSHVDIGVKGGVICSVEPRGAPQLPGVAVDDLGGLLVTTALAEPHAHLDKALTADLLSNPAGDLRGAIAAWSSADHLRGMEQVVDRASTALERLIVNGVTAVRSHVNCGGSIGGAAIEALLGLGDRYDGLVDLQVVALASHPVTGREGASNRAALERAIEAGANLVGGAPHLDPDGAAATAYFLDTAADAGLPVDLHTDETIDPDAQGLAHLARLVIDTGFEHGVTASHCVSLGMQAADVQAATAALVAEAGIGVVALPLTNLYLQGREHPSATPRGLTAVAALRAAGVVVAAGGDNVQDPFNPVGRSDPLEAATLIVAAAHQDPEAALAMVGNDARRVMGLPAVAVAPGSPADLLAIDAPSAAAAMAEAPHTRRVYRHGRLVADSTEHRHIQR